VVVFLVAAGQSVLSAFSAPAEESMLPTLLPADSLLSANALIHLSNRVGRLIGLPLGPVVYALGGLGAVVAADAATFVVAAFLVTLVRAPRLSPGAAEPQGHFFVEWREGVALVRRTRSIGVLFVVFGLMTFGGTMLDPLYAPWVRDVLHAGTGTYALLMTVHAASGIVGSLVIASVASRVSPRLLCGVGSLIAAVLLLLKFNIPLLVVAVALSAISGAVSVGSSVGVDTLAQQRVPAPYRGRVFGTLQATTWLASLLGAAIGGAGAEWIGVVPMLDVASFLVGAAGLVAVLALPARDSERMPAATSRGVRPLNPPSESE
jgi:predicted MFS family arabinose efflux permease